MSYLSTTVQNGILVATLDQPGATVNKLNEALLNEVHALLSRAGDAAIRGIIFISGKENNFIAGADVVLLQQKSPTEVEQFSRRGNALLLQIAHFPKPIVAAIHGGCIGGGNEVAMACHYRIATDHSSTKFAQPEVQLGLLPGGGATQRLPRLIGLQNGLKYLLTGKNMYPRQAKKMGLVDELVHKGVLLKAAKSAVETISAERKQDDERMNLGQKLMEGNPLGRKLIFSQARKRSKKQTKGNMPAPGRIIDCVEEGYRNGIAAGLRKESVLFGELSATPESKAMVRLFFAMQQAKRNEDEKKARSIRKIGILGAGLMGAGIADISANNGYQLLLKDQNMDQAAQGKGTVWNNLDKKVNKHIVSTFERDKIMSRITPTETYAGFEDADLVIEAVFEDLGLKHSIIQQTEQIIPETCIYASNTSSLPIEKIAAASSRPEQVVGMHYFSPVPKMPLMEVIKTKKTADWVTATARQVGLNQGKHVITVNDGPGFYTTRILAPFMNEALLLLDEGIPIEQLDCALTQFGFPVGPAALLDEVGIDVAAHITGVLNPLFKARGMMVSIKPQLMLDAGYKGKKNGQGFYHYAQKDAGKKRKQPNEVIYNFFEARKRSSFNPQEIQHRLVLMMVNEAALCLQENILQRPADGDVGAVLGLGFPPFLGGPFCYIDHLGAEEVVKRLQILQKQHGPRFTPADILQEHAAVGKPFHTD